MNNVGIVVAMKEEFDEVLNIMNEKEKKQIYNITFFKGKINYTDVIVVESGVGKVNAARTTQILIDKLEVKYVINVGSAGALNPSLNIGDIVIANKLIQHDFDITAFGHNKGYITGVGDFINCNNELIEKIQDIINKTQEKKYKSVIGVIASGDIFCTDIKMKEKIYEKFNAECVEMEGAAIAQVCYLNNIPFAVIRSISDSPNGNNAIMFDEFLELASKRCAKILKELF